MNSVFCGLVMQSNLDRIGIWPHNWTEIQYSANDGVLFSPDRTANVSVPVKSLFLKCSWMWIGCQFFAACFDKSMCANLAPIKKDSPNLVLCNHIYYVGTSLLLLCIFKLLIQDILIPLLLRFETAWDQVVYLVVHPI